MTNHHRLRIHFFFIISLLLAWVIITHAVPSKSPGLIIQVDEQIEKIEEKVISLLKDAGIIKEDTKVDLLGIGKEFSALNIPEVKASLVLEMVKTFTGVKAVTSDWVIKADAIEKNAPKGLDFIDGVKDSRFVFQQEAQGSGVDIYVLDTGIDVDHSDFGGRATSIDLTGQGSQDDVGHGTHVAAIAGGTRFGVAKKANIIGIKVLGADGSGFGSTILKGYEMILEMIKKSRRPSVINVSISGPVDLSKGSIDVLTENAINAIVKAGIPVIVAAGNKSKDACTFGPGFTKAAITVAALDVTTDSLANFSNFGTCVDIIAPGVDIVSARANSGSGSKVRSGTSMAAPFVTGVMATLMGTGLKSTDAQSKLLSLTLKGRVNAPLKDTANMVLRSIPDLADLRSPFFFS